MANTHLPSRTLRKYSVSTVQQTNRTANPVLGARHKGFAHPGGGVSGNQEAAFLDRIYQLKADSHLAHNFAGIDAASITVDTPIPFSLHRLWHELIDAEVTTFSDIQRSIPAFVKAGDPMKLIALYQPHGAGSQAPFINSQAPGVKRQLSQLRSRLLDRRYDFLSIQRMVT